MLFRSDDQWTLKSPQNGIVQSSVSARNLWIRLLTARVEKWKNNKLAD